MQQGSNKQPSHQSRFVRRIVGPPPAEVGHLAFLLRACSHALLIALVTELLGLRPYVFAIAGAYIALLLGAFWLVSLKDQI